MDITETTASKSDQMDYQDFLAGPRIVTITEVRKGPSAEQPVEILGEGIERPWRPPKSMRRVLVAAWGQDSDAYIGRHVKLYGDPDVKWAGKAVGGIRIEALSHVSEPVTVKLTVARGKREPYTVQPLPDAPAPQRAAPDGITEQTWQEIASAASAQGIDKPGHWAAEQLGRPLAGPGDITAAEGDRLLRLLTTGETEEGQG